MPGEPTEEVRALEHSSKEKQFPECGFLSWEEHSSGGSDYSLPAHSACSSCPCPALAHAPPNTGDQLGCPLEALPPKS